MVAPNKPSIAPLDEETAAAVTTWGRTVFGAPRKLASFVTRPPEVRDEIIERLVTRVTRRDIGESFAASKEKRSTRPRVDRTTIDPYAYNDTTLRADSEYVAPCDACNSSGSAGCTQCRTSGHVNCSDCSGSGKIRKYYQKSSRLVNCKVCRASGSVRCGDCGGTGAVTCRTCIGSGHLLKWLTIRVTDRWDLALTPDQSPVVVAHPGLRLRGGLKPEQLTEFTLVTDVSSSRGPLEEARLSDNERSLFTAHRASLDHRLERVEAQQYLRLAVRRRDVTFEMCGTRGTLVLSGNKLIGASTPEAQRPIRYRNRAWVASVLAIFILAVALVFTSVGSSDYFHAARNRADLYVWIAMLLAIPAMGALLRAWRGGLQFHRISKPVLAASAAIPLALGAIVVDGTMSKPSMAEATAAVSAKDAERARVVAGALHEMQGATPAVLDLDDRVALLDAATQNGADKLKTLDTVAHRNGPAAAEAVKAARTERLQIIEGQLKQNDAKSALGTLHEWFPTTKEADVSELWGRAHDLASTQCKDAMCRFAETVAAVSSSSTPARVTAASASRQVLVTALDPKQGDAAELVAHLAHVNTVRAAADQVAGMALVDVELTSLAATTKKWADAERAKVPVIGNNASVAQELLGIVHTTGTTATVDVPGLKMFLTLDASNHCKGIYVVGGGDSRKYQAGLSPDALLSQAVGHTAALHSPALGSAVARWYEGGVPIVIRYNAGDLVELRIGDATP